MPLSEAILIIMGLLTIAMPKPLAIILRRAFNDHRHHINYDIGRSIHAPHR